MKTIKRGIIGVVALILLTSTVQTFGIEGLKLSVHCPDVWLTWPSVDGETYIVQYRETLGTNTPWITLTNSLPADSATNTTIFVHSNRVDCPTGQIFGMMFSGGGGGGSSAMEIESKPVGEQQPCRWCFGKRIRKYFCRWQFIHRDLIFPATSSFGPTAPWTNGAKNSRKSAGR